MSVSNVESNERKKQLMLRMEELINIEGFIRDEVEHQILGNYERGIVEVVEKYIEVGPGFCSVANEVDKNCMRIESELFDLACEYMIEYSLEDYRCWYIDQTAKYAVKRYNEQPGCQWPAGLFDRKVKAVLNTLSAFEERLMFLFLGLEDGELQTEEMIAEREEFKCEPNYIFLTIERILEKFERARVDRVELERLCVQYKREESKVHQ